MKLPIAFLLYTTSLGLAGFTGWQVYELLPLQKPDSKRAAMQRGLESATDRISKGRGRGQVSVDWLYSNKNRPWWDEFKNTNFIGKLPPPPPKKEDPNGGQPPPPEVPPKTPLEDIFELAALVYDGADKGKGKLSHVIVRYKPEANVQAPEWYVRQTAAASATGSYGGPRDGAPPPRRGGNQNFRGGNQNRANNRANNNRNNRNARATTPAMPTAGAATSVVLQKVWIQTDGEDRKDPHLWPPYEHIRLVRVDPSAQSAYFVREEPGEPDKDGKPTRKDTDEERLFKSAANLSQDVLRELDAMEGRDPSESLANNSRPEAAVPKWIESDDITVVGNTRHIGRKQQREFESEGQFFEKVYFDTYTSKRSNLRGLRVTNLDPQLASSYGVVQGDVLLSVNGRAVKTKAQAVQFGKKEYKKGVRNFKTTWLSGGQEVERVYQLPDK
ncbi:MAG: hypothetical protein NXI31_21300 [bacterium]|nr:hypothetical protein [bacterium]